MLRLIFLVIASAFLTRLQAAMLVPQNDLDLKIADGFKATLMAKANATCFTLDSNGRPVIAAQNLLTDISGTPVAKISETITALCFDGKDLIIATPTGIFRYKDSAGPAEKLADIRNARAIRIGPDGALYAAASHSITRIPRAGQKTQTIAEGLTGPRDFDFNSAGDLFTFDADFERDFFLPWYTPARLYHIAHGQDHGFQSRSIKPEYYADTVEILTPIGRTTPAGVAIYRHNRFPAEYRDGIFLCDESGKIFFCKLQKQGSTYRPRLDLFMEGNFVPQQIAIAPDGSILVLTRNSILRIEHTGERGQSLSVVSRLQEILQSPQSLEAWSRSKWIPAARQLGPDAFRAAANDSSLSDAERVRAIEIFSELFGALPESTLKEAAAAKSPAVRAQTARALALHLTDATAPLLRRLAQDTDATVRRVALESILVYEPPLNPAALLPILRQNLDHPDKRLRQAAARICARLPIPEWERLWDADVAYSVQTELSLLLAATWRNPALREEIFWRTLETIPLARDNSTRLQALRLLTISFGDATLQNSSPEAFAHYELTRPVPEEFATNALPHVRKIFTSDDPLTAMESARLLAMLQDDSAETIQKIERQLDLLNSPTSNLHYLIVLAKLRAPWPDTLPPKVAEFLKTFESKLPERERRPNQNWKERLREITDALMEKDPRLRELL